MDFLKSQNCICLHRSILTTNTFKPAIVKLMKPYSKIITVIGYIVTLASLAFLYSYKKITATSSVASTTENQNNAKENFDQKETTATSSNPLSIAYMRQQNYLGSNIKIEQTLASGNNYNQYIASYLSDNFKIYGLLTIPQGLPPTNGWPIIIFNHGYIRPDTYNTTKHYELYIQAFASDGYIVFKPDFRGNGNSEGVPDSTYFSPNYTVDVLNAFASLKKYSGVNPNKIGMWGHSDGGNVILRSIVVNTKDIKAAVIWGGVVAPYSDLTTDWQKRVTYQQTAADQSLENNHMQDLITEYGTPANNPNFWNSIDPNNFLSDITTPIQLDVGGSDEEVPIDFSVTLSDTLSALGKKVEYNNYPGLNHNISLKNIPSDTAPFSTAMQNTITFFDRYLK